MAQRRFIAFYMHETEAGVAASIMKNATATESFMIGEVDDADLATLESAGIKLQPLDEPSPPPLRPGKTWVPRPKGVAGFGLTMPLALAPPRPPPLDQPNYFRVSLQGPLIDPWRAQLESAGAKPVESLPGFALTARILPSDLPKVRALPFVKSAEVHEADESLPQSTEVESLCTAALTGTRAMITYDVILRESDSLAAVKVWLEQKKVEIAASAGRKVRIYLLEGSDLVGAISSLPEVDRMEPYIAPKLHNDQARALLGVMAGSPPSPLPLEGEGQVIGIADTGIDVGHPDFAGRVQGVVPLGRPNNFTDTHGHGTHVAGSVLGDGSASGGQFRGTAPKARLFFQSLLDSQGGLGGLTTSTSATSSTSSRSSSSSTARRAFLGDGITPTSSATNGTSSSQAPTLGATKERNESTSSPSRGYAMSW
jgi:serine protease AprX